MQRTAATDYKLEIVVPVRRYVYVTAATKAEARAMAKRGWWNDADEHHHEETDKVRILAVEVEARR
jgi:hypothetical protein